jgi:5-deoxy-glucuronate isomerase
VILITQGFHTTAAAPGSNVYFLNYLAGDLFDDDRKTPPYDDPAHVWIKGNWDGNTMQLPVIT